MGSDILFWAYFFIMDNTCITFVLINDRKMIDAKHVHKLLECKYDFKHWIKYDEIEDRRGGGRGRSRRSDGTYMEYGHGFLPPYDHYGMHEKMKEMEERENELEERERRLEERERRHEMEDREYRRMGYESYPTDYYGDDRYYGDGPQMRRGRGRGRGRSY